MSQFFPDLTGYYQYREPFLGGGSVALWVTKQYPDLLVWVNDLYEPLYNFWNQLQCNGKELESKLLELKQENNDRDKARELFTTCKEEVSNRSLSDSPLEEFRNLANTNPSSSSGKLQTTPMSSFSVESKLR